MWWNILRFLVCMTIAVGGIALFISTTYENCMPPQTNEILGVFLIALGIVIWINRKTA